MTDSAYMHASYRVSQLTCKLYCPFIVHAAILGISVKTFNTGN